MVNAQLKSIDYLDQYSKDNFYIFFGKGQPAFWERVGRAVEDVHQIKGIDRLVIGFDSEDKSCDEKLSEAKEYVDSLACKVEVRFIVQHFCIETWLLGNRDIFRKKANNKELREYYTRFNIRDGDPEDLPDYRAKSMNRAQFAYDYLRLGIRDTYGSERYYTKSNPGIALEEQYFNKIMHRHLNFKHIKSFKGFLDAFVEND